MKVETEALGVKLVKDLVHLKELLESRTTVIQNLLPKHMRVEKFIDGIVVLASKKSELLQVTEKSMIEAIMTGADLGMDFSPEVGLAYLVPYPAKGGQPARAVFSIGYKGLIELARRSGLIHTIETSVVYKEDKFELTFGTQQNLTHTPMPRGASHESPIGVYAIANFANNAKPLIEWMPWGDVEHIKGLSRGKSDSPWVHFPGQMARKSVIRRLTNYLPLSIEIRSQIAKAVEAEDEYFGIETNGSKEIGRLEEGTMNFGAKDNG